MARGFEETSAAGEAKRLYGEFHDHLESGESIDFDLFCEAHAEHAGELRRLHAMWLEVSSVFSAGGGTRSLSRRISERFGVGLDPAISLEREVERLAQRGAAHGRYRVVDEVGRGGMGTVLRVWDEDLRRPLAMKCLREGPRERAADSKSLGRFLEEAQVTGQLDHPGVVPVHELGLDRDGRLYFTMKLVEGRTFGEVIECVHSGRDGWTLARALGVLHKVCEAVAYAHERGVVHRDLKPSNVMVGDFGAVYVMDWGLAHVAGHAPTKDLRIRAGAPDADETAPLYTLDGDVLGTPAYMSPQQALGKAGEVGPPWDVYSLGAMLYHLLTGRMPYVEPGQSASARRILALLLLGSPRRVHEITPDAPDELVAICEKAMERGPERRYSRVQDLAGELQAWLEGRVVRAHATGAWIELRKWVRRNRPLAASLAAAIAIALGGLGSTSYVQAQAREQEKQANVALAATNADLVSANRAASEAQARAEEKAREADRERSTTQHVSDFLVELFDAANPTRGWGHEPSAKEVLDRGREALDHRLVEEPAARAGVATAMGKAYLGLGQHDAAADLFATAVELRREHLGPNHPDTNTAIQSLAQSRVEQGRVDEAIELLRKAIESDDGFEAGEGSMFHDLACNLFTSGDYAGAEEWSKRAIERQSAAFGSDSVETLQSQLVLADVYTKLRRLDEAAPLLEHVVERFAVVLPAESEWNLRARDGLVYLRTLQGRLDDALQLSDEVLAVKRRTYDADHPALLTSEQMRVQLHMARREPAQARALIEELLPRFERQRGTSSKATLNLISDLGTTYTWKGEWARAEELHRRAYDGLSASQPSGDPDIAGVEYRLAFDVWKLGRTEEALALARSARDRLGPTSPHAARLQQLVTDIEAAVGAPPKQD